MSKEMLCLSLFLSWHKTGIVRKNVQARSTVRIEHHANKKNLTLDTITRKNILRYARKTQDMFLDDCRKAMLG